MLNLMLQLQMLLAALSAFLPLVPVEQRSRAAEIFDVAAKALAAGGSVATNLDDLAAKLAAIRSEVEANRRQRRDGEPGATEHGDGPRVGCLGRVPRRA